MTRVQPAPALDFQPAGGDGLDAVMGIMAAAFDPRFGEAWTRAQCAGILPMRGVSLTLACSDGEAAGFSLARAIAGEAELLLLAVAPEVRGRGIGGGLLRHFVEQARASGVSRLHLEVRDGNSAVQLYQDNDFRVEGRRSKYYRGADGELHDALTMVRNI